jgi:pyridoxine 4-dehydrogenase
MRELSGWLLRARRWGRTAVESVRSKTEGRRMTDQDARRNAAAAGTFSLGGDLLVNRLGFGAMRLTGRGILGEPEDPEEARRVLRRAVELGVNLIDTADSYGPEVSERLIAETLHPYPDDLVIATKGGFTRPGGRWVPNGRPEHLREACEGSLKRLKVERIDLYQLHRPDPRIAFEDSVWALALLREEGKIRHVGLSNVGVRELEIALDIVPVASVQNRYNLSDRSSEAVLQACEREGVGFIPWYPLATGRLAGSGGPLEEVAERHEATPSQVALAWLLGHSPVMLPIPGTSSVAHLEENVAAATLELTEEEMAMLERT